MLARWRRLPSCSMRLLEVLRVSPVLKSRNSLPVALTASQTLAFLTWHATRIVAPCKRCVHRRLCYSSSLAARRRLERYLLMKCACEAYHPLQDRDCLLLGRWDGYVQVSDASSTQTNDTGIHRVQNPYRSTVHTPRQQLLLSFFGLTVKE
jgi:hypothetical protein